MFRRLRTGFFGPNDRKGRICRSPVRKRRAAAIPGATFEWVAARSEFTCTFPERSGTVATVNRALLPLLLAQTDVLAATPGLSLEQIYLGR